MAGTICNSAKIYFSEMTKLLDRVDCRQIDAFADLLHRAWRERRRVFMFGNGGSASTASHHVLDLVKTASVDGQPRLLALCMNDNFGITTAVGNDITYEESFTFPLSSYAQKGDVAVALTCSGNSPNILHACRWARENGLTVVALTGFAGGKVKDLAHVHLNIPSDNYGLVEDMHLSIGHIVAQSLKSRIESDVTEGSACKY
jgi:D-sedoheptulose 7-phosphate isomerase